MAAQNHNEVLGTATQHIFIHFYYCTASSSNSTALVIDTTQIWYTF